MREFFRQYRELIVIAALLAVTSIVWVAHAKKGRDLTPLDRAALMVTSPVQRGVNAVAFGAIDLFYGYVDLRGVRQRNEELLRENFRLRESLAAMEEISAENLRLRELTGFVHGRERQLVSVRIVGEGVGRNGLTVAIDRGSEEGIRKGMPAVASTGVVGRVSSVAPGVASVVLLSDPTTSIPVRVQRTRVRGVVRGQGSGKDFVLERVERVADVQDGDLLVTSGTDGVFPKGIPVGRVKGLSRPDHGMFLGAMVAPAVDLTCPDTRMEEFFVISDFQGRNALEEAENAPDAEEGEAER